MVVGEQHTLGSLRGYAVLECGHRVRERHATAITNKEPKRRRCKACGSKELNHK